MPKIVFFDKLDKRSQTNLQIKKRGYIFLLGTMEGVVSASILLNFIQIVPFIEELVTISYTKTSIWLNYIGYMLFLINFNIEYESMTKKILSSIPNIN